MVRKRSRKYESSDENDSDSDAEFVGDAPPKASSQPAAKRYSLRERRAPPPEFDFFGLADDEDDGDADGVEGPTTKQSTTDDEDFEVDLKTLKRRQNGARNDSDDDDDNDDDDDYIGNEVETLPYKNCEATLDTTAQNGLIDFEDIIRADIVVRKKVDYDNIIEKSTICLNSEKSTRDTRKPKNFYNENHDEVVDEQLNIFEPQIETHMQNDDEDLAHLSNVETNLTTDNVPNFINSNEKNSIQTENNGNDLPQQICNKQSTETIVNDSGGGGGDNIDATTSNNNNNNSNNRNKIEDEDDDDVIVLGELKQDIIVLDD